MASAPVPAADIDEGAEVDWDINDLEHQEQPPLGRMPKTFQALDQYVDTFTAFLDQEMAEERKKREFLNRNDYNILWNPQRDVTAAVRVSQTTDIGARDQVLIVDPNGVSCRFWIMKIDKENSSLFLRAIGDMLDFFQSDINMYTMSFFASQVHMRMKAGLQRFAAGGKVNQTLATAILGSRFPEEVNLRGGVEVPPGLALNESQREAVEFAMANPLALIQGPPGTGKTATAAAIVYNFVRNMREKVLVCAPSNVAVDHLTLNLAQYPDLRPLRIYSRTIVQSEEILLAEKSALHWEARERLAQEYPRLAAKIMDRKVELKDLDEIPETVVTRVESSLIEASNVVCCTCSSSMIQSIRDTDFGAVVLDEAGYATEPDSLLPVLLGCSRFVLIGDVNQLPPFVQSRAAITLGFGRSMFQRLIESGAPSRLIRVQYRMHPDICFFSNREFYKNQLENGVEARDRERPGLDLFWSSPHPFMFYHVSGAEEAAGSWSFMNNKEAVLIEELVFRLVSSKVNTKDIGVITAYEGQREHILRVIKRKGRVQLGDMEVKNIDGFQGREKDYILISCVRSNMDGDMGFLQSPNRLNVMITRARFGLVMLGNKAVLGSNKLWRKLIAYFQTLKQLRNGDEILRSLGE